MPPITHLTREHPSYPARLLFLPSPPPSLSVEGPPDGALLSRIAVAIVGTRHPLPAAAAFAAELAGAVASRGGVVVSGGAKGIDAMAHEGALAAGGRTWVVTGTGHGVLYPRDHGPLFARIVAAGGALVSPFPPGTTGHPSRFLQRNGVLAALSDVLVVVQARIPSGALNAASWAKRLRRPRWVVCPAPWSDAEAFAGCHSERKQGAQALTSVDFFIDQLALPAGSQQPLPRPGPTAPLRRTNPAETRVLAALDAVPRHTDEVVVRCGLPYPEVMTALLTLALDDVLVEGPEGSFRLPSPP